MRKILRRINAGLSLITVGWLAYAIGGEAAYQDFLRQLKTYVKTGQSDTSWIEKYLR